MDRHDREHGSIAPERHHSRSASAPPSSRSIIDGTRGLVCAEWLGGSGGAIEQEPPAGQELVEQVEIAQVAGDQRQAGLAGLQVDQRVVQAGLLLAGLEAAEAEQQARKCAGHAPGIGIGDDGPPGRDVLDGRRKLCQHRACSRMGRIEPTEGMGQLGDADGAVIADARTQQPVQRIG